MSSKSKRTILTEKEIQQQIANLSSVSMPGIRAAIEIENKRAAERSVEVCSTILRFMTESKAHALEQYRALEKQRAAALERLSTRTALLEKFVTGCKTQEEVYTLLREFVKSHYNLKQCDPYYLKDFAIKMGLGNEELLLQDED